MDKVVFPPAPHGITPVSETEFVITGSKTRIIWSFYTIKMAGIVVLLSFVLGIFSFGRVANTGVEALGRNPLAGRMIQLGIVVNALITVAIIGAGMFIAYVIVRF